MNRSEISSVLGISGIERDHLIDALKRQGVDWQAIDWRTVGEDIKDYSNKYEAIWDKLQNEYGVSYPAEWRYKDYPKYKQQEYEFNAETLKEYLKESEDVSYYNQVMNALCLGTEPVPQEIDEAIGYTGRERKAFLEVLCRGYEPSGWVMPYSSVWDRASRDMLSEKYKSLWTEDDRHLLKRIADDAGISGRDGSYASCYSRDKTYGEVSECLKRVAQETGLSELYQKGWEKL